MIDAFVGSYMQNRKPTKSLKELTKNLLGVETLELEDFFFDTEDKQRQTAYDNGYRKAKGIEVASKNNEYINNKFESAYIDGFMVGLGELSIMN